MLLNLSFEKTISLELEIDDDVNTDDLDALVEAIRNADADIFGYADGAVNDTPVVCFGIEDENGSTLFGGSKGRLSLTRHFCEYMERSV